MRAGLFFGRAMILKGPYTSVFHNNAKELTFSSPSFPVAREIALAVKVRTCLACEQSRFNPWHYVLPLGPSGVVVPEQSWSEP